MKALCTVIAVALIVAAGASAQQNDVTFKQTQGEDGLFHYDVGVSYAFPGLPPRTNNSGVGTVRVTLPGADFTLDPVQPADPGYSCALDQGYTGSSSATCSSEGQPQGNGTAFPNSTTIHLVSKSCWAPEAGQSGTADVWAAPTDPGTAPDVTLSIQPGECAPDPGLQPVLDTKETCKVPNVKNLTVKLATRELAAGQCRRGKVNFAFSPKVKKGRVMKQSQRPGKTLKVNSKVNLVVSRGKKP